jgi:hypothetical protein
VATTAPPAEVFARPLPDGLPASVAGLRSRIERAERAGRAGDAEAAYQGLPAVVDEIEDVAGAGTPATLDLHHQLAQWAGESGRGREAIVRFTELTRRRERRDGGLSPPSLLARSQTAHRTARNGDPERAVRLYDVLVQAARRLLGEDHELVARWRLAGFHWLAVGGDPEVALGRYPGALEAARRVLPPGDPDLVGARMLHDRLVSARGSSAPPSRQTSQSDEMAAVEAVARTMPPQAAADWLRAVAEESARVHGPYDLRTINARLLRARRTAEAGDRRAAIRRLDILATELQQAPEPGRTAGLLGIELATAAVENRRA